MVTTDSLSHLTRSLVQVSGSEAVARREVARIVARYGDIDFGGAHVLDIGGGLGAHSFFAVTQGASRVVCLDPGGDGALHDYNSVSSRFRQSMGLENVLFLPVRLQDFNSGAQSFDIIIMNNSINHMDEPACEQLPDDEEAKQAYSEVFEQIALLSKPDTILVASDCSPQNIWTKLGRKNPFAPTIEWGKHQPPEVWIEFMLQAGFTDPQVRWFSIQRLGRIGKFLLGNRIGAYLTDSYFRIITHRCN